MIDVTKTEIKQGDLFLHSNSYTNELEFGMFKRQNKSGTYQYYPISSSGLEKLQWDNGIKIKVPPGVWGYNRGRYYGQKHQISFLVNTYKRTFKVTEDQLPEDEKEIYKKMKKIINGNTGS